MGKFIRNSKVLGGKVGVWRSQRATLIITLVFTLAASCLSVAYSQESSEKAKGILEKTVKKYSKLLKKDGKEVESVEAKISIKGGGQFPMGEGGGMPLDLDAVIELYIAKPHNLYLGISGNLGNATIIVAGREKKMATVILPSTMQFAAIDIPEETMKKIDERGEADEFEKPPEMDELLKEAILAYEGTEKVKAGKAHKINIKSRKPSDEGSVTVYVVDGKWDPARLELNSPDGGSVVVEFEKLELNKKISEKTFVPKIEGYTQITKDQLTAVIMMQIMGAMMQQGGGGGIE